MMEQFLKENWDAVHSNLFVFHIQPIRYDLSCAVVHVLLSTSKKSNNEVIELLELISDIVQQNRTFNVIDWVYDGDSASNSIVNCFVERNIHSISQTVFTGHFDIKDIEFPLQIPDLLHVLKRFRYRLIGKVLVVGPFPQHQILELSKLKQLLELPSAVFDTSRFSKMHDSLP